MQFGIFTPDLSIDEQMVPYFGRHSSKMYIRGKPIRFGFKNWCLCSSNGYLYQFIPYGGASTYHDKQIGLGASVILDLLGQVEYPERHIVYFDNFFTSYYLMCLLSERKFFATGTIRKGRLAGCQLKSGKNLHKGDTDYKFDKTNDILMLRWQDNSEVTLATNFQGIEPIHNVKRWDKKNKQFQTRTQADVIWKYNQSMGGVDLHDNAVANYRISIRGKKWWNSLFCNGLDAAAVNAWKLHCFIKKNAGLKPMSQIDFKIQITEALLLANEEEDEKHEMNNESDDNRLPNLSSKEHIIVKGKARLRCKNKCGNSKDGSNKTTFMCQRCNVYLHTKCFEDFHKNK